MKRIIRVFPRKTKASPTDDLALFSGPDLFSEADEVHISVAFTYDLNRAEKLARAWKHVAPVKIGGPATGERGDIEFTPGMYLKPGYVITSRGCPNRCWFCAVWKREGKLKELKVKEGFNVLDDNLLACSEEHIKEVFKMLSRQKEAPEFTGGLEAARLKQWHVDKMLQLKPKQLFFAYDTPEDYEPLREAGKMLLNSGFKRSSHSLRCYLLCGFSGDSLSAAEQRIYQALEAGFIPFPMVWRGDSGARSKEWIRFQKVFSRPWFYKKEFLEKDYFLDKRNICDIIDIES